MQRDLLDRLKGSEVEESTVTVNTLKSPENSVAPHQEDGSCRTREIKHATAVQGQGPSSSLASASLPWKTEETGD